MTVEEKTAVAMDAKKAEKREYYRNYYNAQRERIMKLVSDRRRLVKESDLYRQKLIDQLNTGRKKWVYISTLKSMGCNRILRHCSGVNRCFFFN